LELMITDRNQVCFAKMAGWLLQEAMFRGGPSFAQRIGRQVYRGSTGEPPKIEDFFQKVMGHIFLLPCRCFAHKVLSKDFIP